MTSTGRLIETIRSYRLFWIICGALFLANLLFYGLFVASVSRKTTQLHAQFMAEREKISEQRKRQAEIDRFAAQQAVWTAFEESLPGKLAFPERIQKLKEILNRYQLNAADLSFRSEPMIDENMVRFTTAFQTSGPYEGLKRFIGELLTMDGLFCIHKIEILRPEAGKPLEMNMELSAYFRDDNHGAVPEPE